MKTSIFLYELDNSLKANISPPFQGGAGGGWTRNEPSSTRKLLEAFFCNEEPGLVAN